MRLPCVAKGAFIAYDFYKLIGLGLSMRTWKLLFTVVLTMLYLPVAIAQQSPEGTWTMIDDKGDKRLEVNLRVQDGTLTGTIKSVYPQPGDTGFCSKCPGDFKDKPTQGLQFVWGMREVSADAWGGGQILDPKSGRIYSLKMTMDGNKLLVRGYFGLAMLGRTQVWLRH